MKIPGLPIQKLGVVAASNPFKKVMSGVKEPGPRLPTALPKPPAPIKGGVTPKVPMAQPHQAAAKPAPVAKLEEARAQAHAKAAQLVEHRKDGFVEQHKRYDTRLVDLICQELKIEFGEEKRVQQTAANSDRPVQPPQQQQVATVTPIAQAAKQEAEV